MWNVRNVSSLPPKKRFCHKFLTQTDKAYIKRGHWTEKKLTFPKAVGSIDFQSKNVEKEPPPDPVDPQPSESDSDKENIELSDTTESESEDEDLQQEMARRKTKPEMMPIGDGHVYVPKCVFKCIDWTSHTMATRKLLLAVFPRRMLGTSSLTGKCSPAFPHLPPKKKLPAKMVSDIIQTVAERCRVSTGLVRTAITNKCADEGKLLRERRRN